MPILNYTTEVSAEKSVGEIVSWLVQAKATQILHEYSEGVISHISFRVMTPHGEMAFRLPGNIEGMHKAMQRAKIPPRLKTKAQAARVAWRVLKDWLRAQLTLIEADMATLPQVFLPYMQTPDGQTVYERFEKVGMKSLAIGYRAEPSTNGKEG